MLHRHIVELVLVGEQTGALLYDVRELVGRRVLRGPISEVNAVPLRVRLSPDGRRGSAVVDADVTEVHPEPTLCEAAPRVGNPEGRGWITQGWLDKSTCSHLNEHT